MKQRIKSIIVHPLFSGSLVMIIGSNITNVVNYVYNLIVGRMLGPANYGELAAIFSLIGLFGMIPFSLGLVIIRYVSLSKTHGEVVGIIHWFSKRIFVLAIFLVLIIVLAYPLLSSFLNIKDGFLIILAGVSFLFSVPSFLNKSVLQGVLRFKEMVISVLLENSTKLILAVILIYIGFGVGGAVTGFVMASFVGFVLSKIFIRDYSKPEAERTPPNTKPILLYSLPVLVQSLALTSLYSADIILVKHFFSSHDAGLYASLSYLGRIIFFGAGPIASVMFPMISQKQGKGESYRRTFLYSFLFTGALIVGVLTIYKVVPQLMIEILYGSSYLGASSFLLPFGIFMSLFTLASLLVNLHLSLGSAKVVVFPLIASALQIVGIYFFHNSLSSVIGVSIADSAILLLILVLYSLKVDIFNRFIKI